MSTAQHTPGPWHPCPQIGFHSGRVNSWLVSRLNPAAAHGTDTLRDEKGRGIVFRTEAAALAASAKATGSAA